MRDYSIVSPQFWTGRTGKQIRAMGHDAQVIALYLITCPSANMIGLYYLPLPTLCHETGIPSGGALKALASLSEALFCHFDAQDEVVWVVEMARHQIEDQLDPKDNRCKGILKEAMSYKKTRYFKDFWLKYKIAFHLPDIDFEPSPSKPPSKPLRSQDQEQDQEQEQKRESTSFGGCAEPLDAASAPAPPPVIQFPCTGKAPNLVPITQDQLQEWQKDFPGVDVPQELRSMRAWLMANPTKRKTTRGVPAFVVRWLSREQNNPKAPARAAPPGGKSYSKTPEMDREYEQQLLAAGFGDA